MNVDYINPFLVATTNVIETMASIKVSAGAPGLKPDNKTWGAVTGIVGMAGDKLQGNMVLSFDENSIVEIVNNMLGETFTEVNKDVVDAVGELTNMICGGAKRLLSEKGFNFDMAVPVMVSGKNVEVSQLNKGPILSVPFSTSSGKFVVEANLTERIKSPS